MQRCLLAPCSSGPGARLSRFGWSFAEPCDSTRPAGTLHPTPAYFAASWSPFSALTNVAVSHSAQCQRRQLTAPGSEPAVTSLFHPPKAAKTSPFSRSGTPK